MTVDTIIVGAGLSGLYLTHRLHAQGHRVALLESVDTLGGRYRHHSDLEFIPLTDEHQNLARELRDLLPVPIHHEVQDHAPLLFDEGRFKAFAGFGETHFQSVDMLTHMGATQELRLQPSLNQLTRVLVEQLPVVAQTLSEVTEIKVADQRVSELVINGDKSIKAENIIFTSHPQALNKLMAGDDLAAKHRTRLARSPGWMAVYLELTHPQPLTEDKSLHFFTHSAKEFEPVVGRVFGQVSRWLTLVSQERDADHEFTGQCIRHIKRQLKRAWPTCLDGEVSERIFVQSSAFGPIDLKTKERYRLPEISNLFLANHLLSPEPSSLGALHVAREVEQLLAGSANVLPDLGPSC